MSDLQRDEPAREPISGRLPATFPTQVVRLIGDDPPYQSGDLPIWSRLGHASRCSNRWLPRLAWCVAAALLVVALLRLVAHDRAVLLTWLNAFTLYLYLPAYLVLVYAASTRRWWLATASVAVVAFHVAWVAPDLRPATPYVPPEATTPEGVPLKIYYDNVRGGANLQMDDVLAEIDAAQPDIIILAEMKREWWLELIRRRPFPDHPYGSNLPNRNMGDVGIFSRLPVRRMEQVVVEHRVVLVLNIPLVQSETARGELRLVALHSPRPNFGKGDNYYAFWERILTLLAKFTGPEVVIGDFNATQHSRVYQQLLALGLRSAHEDRGRGYATTWPNGKQPIPPIRIDQAMLSHEVECVSIREGVGPGSDHKPLILDLRVHLPESAATGD